MENKTTRWLLDREEIKTLVAKALYASWYKQTTGRYPDDREWQQFIEMVAGDPVPPQWTKELYLQEADQIVDSIVPPCWDGW